MQHGPCHATHFQYFDLTQEMMDAKVMNSAVENQKAVTTYFSSKQ